MVTVGYTVVACIVMIYNMVIRGITLSVLWNWFVTPTFNTASLGLAPAIGIILISNFFVKPQTKKYDKFSDVFADSMIKNTVDFVLLLGIGYVVKLFM